MKKEIILPTVEDSIKFAQDMAAKARKGDVYMLYGELGAGKTFFVSNFCKEIGVKDIVSSPSYVLLNEYDSDEYLVFHLDLYRLGSEEEIYELGIIDFIDNNITFIEWPEIAEEMIAEERIELYFEYVDDHRKVTVVDRRKHGS
jgi:tRNA threonylcarbamoyladenosine biosynthesis protein TsaE